MASFKHNGLISRLNLNDQLYNLGGGVQIITFCAIGIFGAGLSYVVFFLLFWVLEIYYVVSGALGFLASFFISFVLHHKWTFKSNLKFTRCFLPYLTVNFIGILIHCCVQWLSGDFFAVPLLFTQILGIAFAAVSNYTLLNKFVFPRRTKSDQK